jgi:preprotein translocase subunit SecA
MHAEVEVEHHDGEGGTGGNVGILPPPSGPHGGYTYEHADAATLEALAAGAGTQMDEPEELSMPIVEQRHVDPEKNVGRNDPCWCGSGKKYKRCHGA